MNGGNNNVAMITFLREAYRSRVILSVLDGRKSHMRRI